MDFATQLSGYRNELNDDIAAYCLDILRITEGAYGSHSQEALAAFTAILNRGGKRIRGSLVMAIYELFGGTQRQAALHIARATEVVHAYLLVADDITDRSILRRGGPTAHLLMSGLHEKRHLRGEASHFGDVMAMTTAMLGMSLAETIILETPLSDKVRVRLLTSLHGNLIHTVHGQLRDIWNEALPTVNEKDALQVAELKTAYYTFVNPLEMGALLAGVDDTALQHLRRYGLKAGIAFQIVDDIIGMFSSSAKSGKSAMDDMMEGKMTILTTFALAHATPAQQNYLQQALGNKQITQREFARCQEIITTTGALSHAQQLASRYTEEALAVVERSTLPKKVGSFLQGLARYTADRQV